MKLGNWQTTRSYVFRSILIPRMSPLGTLSRTVLPDWIVDSRVSCIADQEYNGL